MAAPEEVLAPTLVREQLARILANSLFSGSPMLSRLLTFIVEQTLGGKAGELKEYALAIAVFGRAASFDSRLDPIVRVQASNVRSRLKAYCSTEGASDIVDFWRSSIASGEAWIDRLVGSIKCRSPAARMRFAAGTIGAVKTYRRALVLHRADRARSVLGFNRA